MCLERFIGVEVHDYALHKSTVTLRWISVLSDASISRRTGPDVAAMDHNYIWLLGRLRDKERMKLGVNSLQFMCTLLIRAQCTLCVILLTFIFKSWNLSMLSTTVCSRIASYVVHGNW